jgi:hypothetical protein
MAPKQQVAKKQFEVSPELAAAAANIEKPDGSVDLEKFRTIVSTLYSEETTKKLEIELVKSHAPKGTTELIVATWNCGVRGKVYTVLAGVGATTAIMAAAEGLGRILDVPKMQVLSNLTRALLD